MNLYILFQLLSCCRGLICWQSLIRTLSHHLPCVVCRCCCSQVLQFCALFRVCQSTSYLRKREILMVGGSVVGNSNVWVWRRTAGHVAAVGASTSSLQTPRHRLPTAHLHSKVYQLGQNVKSHFVIIIAFDFTVICFNCKAGLKY